MNKWNNLTMKEKAVLIKVGVANGFRNIDDIKDQYNSFYSDQQNYDYDMARWDDEVEDKNELFNHQGHYTDKYKKPNHPTFSDESIYSNEQTPGGKWGYQNGHDTFTPSEYQVNTYGPQHIVQGLRNQGDTDVIPTYLDGTLLDEINVYPSKFEDGGSTREQSINRANYVATNYNDANDFDMNPILYAANKVSKDLINKGLLSNCTLSATQWIDPSNQYMSAKNIVGHPDSGYTEISPEYALPGDLIISRNPDKNKYHTMLIEGFDENNQPLVRYSRGGHNTEENLVKGITLDNYHAADINQGGYHTEDHYFRPNVYNEHWLPELIVTPNNASMGNYSKASGGYLDILPKPLSYGNRPDVLY